MGDLLARLRGLSEQLRSADLCTDEDAPEEAAARIGSMADLAEQEITAWAFANNIDGAIRNDLMRRVRAALTAAPGSMES